jgi:ectoine hydroxylase
MRHDAYPSRLRPEPDWLTRQDPVAHAPWRSDAPLDRDQHESFERDGYLALEGLFEPEEIEALQGELARLQGLPDELDLDTVIAEPDSGALRSIFAIHEQSPLFARLASDVRLVAVAQHLLADEVYVHQSRLNYKTGFDGKEFYWHSDFETWHVEDGMPRMRALSMSIQLADNHAVNGPLMLMPGSQDVFVTCVGETPHDHYKQSLRRQEYGVPDRRSLARLAERGGIVAPTGPAGSVIVFDCNTMHGSNGNITPYPRANAFIVFNAMTNRLDEPYGGHRARPEFIACRKPFALRPLPGLLTDPRPA